MAHSSSSPGSSVISAIPSITTKEYGGLSSSTHKQTRRSRWRFLPFTESAPVVNTRCRHRQGQTTQERRGGAVGPGGRQLPGSGPFGEEPVVFGFVYDVHGHTSPQDGRRRAAIELGHHGDVSVIQTEDAAFSQNRSTTLASAARHRPSGDVEGALLRRSAASSGRLCRYVFVAAVGFDGFRFPPDVIIKRSTHPTWSICWSRSYAATVHCIVMQRLDRRVRCPLLPLSVCAPSRGCVPTADMGASLI